MWKITFTEDNSFDSYGYSILVPDYAAVRKLRAQIEREGITIECPVVGGQWIAQRRIFARRYHKSQGTKGEGMMDKLDLTQFDGSTPEPWRTAIDLAALRRPGQHKVIICVQTGGANARLIAAAPTLLRELKGARAEIERLKAELYNLHQLQSYVNGDGGQASCADAIKRWGEMLREIEQLKEENERLRAENEVLIKRIDDLEMEGLDD